MLKLVKHKKLDTNQVFSTKVWMECWNFVTENCITNLDGSHPTVLKSHIFESSQIILIPNQRIISTTLHDKNVKASPINADDSDDDEFIPWHSPSVYILKYQSSI